MGQHGNAPQSRPALADIPDVIATTTGPMDGEPASMETITLRQQRCSFFDAGIECSWRTETGMRVLARAVDYEQAIDLVMVVLQDIEVSLEMANVITVIVDMMTANTFTVGATEMIEQLSQIEIEIETSGGKFSSIHTDILAVAFTAEIIQ